MRLGIKKGEAFRPKYHGKPCKHCGSTLRYNLDRHCVSCHDSRRSVENTRLRRLYGITSAYFAEIIKKQKGLCLICEKEKKLVPDHNHNTGKFRGALCVGCNTALGKLGDSEYVIKRALDYITNKL